MIWQQKHLPLSDKLTPAKLWGYSHTLAPASNTYPVKMNTLHFPTNEIGFDHLSFAHKTYPIEEAVKLARPEKGAILSVGAELGIYYGEKFNAKGLINIDINPGISFLWFPFLVYISGFSATEQRSLVNSFCSYASAWNIINTPTQSPEHQKLQDAAFQNKELAPEKIKTFMSGLRAEKNEQYLKYFKGFAPGLQKEQEEWPLFVNKHCFSFLNHLHANNNLLFLHGSVVEASSFEFIANASPQKIKLIYLSNVLDYLNELEKQNLKKYLQQLDRTKNCMVIISAGIKNYLYRFEEFIDQL